MAASEWHYPQHFSAFKCSEQDSVCDESQSPQVGERATAL